MRKFFVMLLLVILLPIAWVFITKPTFETFAVSPKGLKAQKFTEIKTPFTHKWVETAHPFTGAAVIDIDGDGALEVFVGGGRGQEDMLLAYKDGALVDISQGKGLSDSAHATHGMASSDMDLDGDIDLVVARENGVTLYLNEGGQFQGRLIPLTLDKNAIPLSVAIADANQDGLPDIYVSVFVSFAAFKAATFNDPEHAKKNIMLINQGGVQFKDKTSEMGVSGLNNTFHSVFADLDRNGSLELILSQNTGEIEVFTPNKNGAYGSVPTKTGFGFWMGLGVGDYDRDGDEDIFASNVGTSIPDFLTKGDLKTGQRQNSGWGLFETLEGLRFRDVTSKVQIDKYGFAWGAQFEDLNLDGEIDLIVAQNYIKWFLHKFAPLNGKVLLQAKGSKGRGFYHSSEMGLDNPFYGQSPIIMDINRDGRPDVLWLNMAGPLRAFLNKSSGSFISFDVPDTAANYGAVISIGLGDGTILKRQVIASTGLMTDPSPHIHFGLGDVTSVKWAEIKSLTGSSARLYFPKINSVHKLTP